MNVVTLFTILVILWIRYLSKVFKWPPYWQNKIYPERHQFYQIYIYFLGEVARNSNCFCFSVDIFNARGAAWPTVCPTRVLSESAKFEWRLIIFVSFLKEFHNFMFVTSSSIRLFEEFCNITGHRTKELEIFQFLNVVLILC